MRGMGAWSAGQVGLGDGAPSYDVDRMEAGRRGYEPVTDRPAHGLTEQRGGAGDGMGYAARWHGAGYAGSAGSTARVDATTVKPVAFMPYLKALRRERDLPSGVVGPVLFWAFRRLAVICFSLVM